MRTRLSESEQKSTPLNWRAWGLFGFLASCVGIAASFNIHLIWFSPETRPLPNKVERGVEWAQPVADGPEAPADLSFHGKSEKLQESVVLPTLERKIPQGKSAVWCATFPMAWRELDKTVGKIQIDGVEDLCAELSSAADPKLEARDFFVAAGPAENDIVGRIRRELPKQFPNGGVENLPEPKPGAILAIAHLEAALNYDFNFNYSEEPL